MSLKQLKAWHDTKKGLMVFGVIELLAAYFMGSRAIDTGSLIEYFLTAVLFIGALHNFSRLISGLIHGK